MNPNEFMKYAVRHRGMSGMHLEGYMRHSVTGLTPYIIEERPLNVAQLDVFSRLMMDRNTIYSPRTRMLSVSQSKRFTCREMLPVSAWERVLTLGQV